MKSMIKKFLKDKKVNLITILVLVFVSITLLFPAGALNPSGVVENTAEYLADVAKNHTDKGIYAGLVVEPNDVTDKKVNNPYTEFHYLYGIFKEGLATYIGSANAEKSHVVRIKELEDNTNFSFLNVDGGFGVKEYYKDEDGNMVYKQEFYPLELMFYSNHPVVPGAISFIYIPQSKADLLLDKAGLEHTRENYKSLLNSVITLEFDGIEYKYAIDNIYLQQHYFYDAIDEVMGDFLLGSFYPNSALKKQALFFLRGYAFQNMFYINHAASLYPTSDFNYMILRRNITDNYQIDDSKLLYVPNFSDIGSILLLALSIALLVLAAALILFGSFEERLFNHLFVATTLFTPYLIFWFIHLFTGSELLFSNFAVVSAIWSILIFVVAYLIIYLLKKNKGKDYEINSHEIEG